MTMYPTSQQTSPQHKEDLSIGELLSNLTQDMLTLVRQELTLAKTEMSAKLANVTKNLGMVMAGGALAYAGVLMLVACLALLLDEMLHRPWLSALIVGVVVTGIGGVLVMKGLNAMKNADLTPHQTLDSLKELKHG